MKYQLIVPPVCLLLLWTLTGFVSCDGEITVKTVSDGIQLSCGAPPKSDNIKKQTNPIPDGKLPYTDDNTGEYDCTYGAPGAEKTTQIFVKYRSCDNCIELDEGAIAGIVVGDLLATVVIGVAVYLIASQGGSRPGSSDKKSSDRQRLVPMDSGSGASSDPYQQLKFRKGQKDIYDKLDHQRP